jgi:glycosyltransferase involved in cell wall biosynthesis
VFLRALAQVRRAVPRAKGIVVGGSVPYEPGYRDQLLALGQALGLSGNVAFHDYRPDVPRLMSALDVLVLPSVSPEPFGRVLIEAMAAGKPVVATDAGATPEVIDDGEQGLLVPANDAQSMAAAVTRLLLDSSLATSMGQKGRRRVEARFTAQHYVDGVQAIYREVLT